MTTPTAPPINCPNTYIPKNLLFKELLPRNQNPNETDGLKWAPQKGAQKHIAKYNDNAMNILWKGLGTLSSMGVA